MTILNPFELGAWTERVSLNKGCYVRPGNPWPSFATYDGVKQQAFRTLVLVARTQAAALQGLP